MSYKGGRIILGVMLIVLLLSGCAKVGPDFQRPHVAMPLNWMEAKNERVKTEAADYRNWWRAFNDPILNILIDRAYGENLSLRVAGVRVLEARAQVGIAMGDLYPQPQASGFLQYNRLSEKAARSAQALSYTEADIEARATWELDFWGRFRRTVESADANWLATVADYDNALVTLTADVATSYIAIRTLEKRLAIAYENAEARKESVRIAEARFQNGAVTQLDVEQARAALNETFAIIPSLETQLRQAKNALSVLLGMAPNHLSEFFKGASEIPISPPQVVAGIPADLLRRRPDIRSAEYQAAAQSARIGVAKADFYPAISLSGSFGFLSTDINPSNLTDIFQWGSRTAEFGPSFQWNFMSFGRIRNNIRIQDARLQEMLINYQNRVLIAQREVEDNLVAFLKAQERATLLAQSAAAAKNAFDIAILQYREGVKDFTPVLTAQIALLNEQDNLAAAMGAISTNLVGVYRALGGGWEIREGKDLVPAAVKEDMTKRTNWGALLAPASYNPPVANSQ